MRSESATRTAMLARRVQLASLLFLGCVSLAMAADKAAELSDDFLEYLGSLEGEADSWQDFTAEAVAEREPAPQVAASSSSAAASATTRTTAKLDKADK